MKEETIIDSEEEVIEEDDEDDFNVTLRTPARMRISNSREPEIAPLPELRFFEEDSDKNMEKNSQVESDLDRPIPSSASHLRGPSIYRRANSNYTLSSLPASRASSAASFTTGSIRNFSRASSLASNPSERISGSDVDTGVDSGSNMGTIKGSAALGYKRGLAAKASTTNRQPLQPSRSILSNSKTVSSRTSGTARPFKASALRTKPSAQRSTGSNRSSDTTDVDEFGMLGNGDDAQGGVAPSTRRRNNKITGASSGTRPNVTVGLDSTPSDLSQILEEKDGRMPGWI